MDLIVYMHDVEEIRKSHNQNKGQTRPKIYFDVVKHKKVLVCLPLLNAFSYSFLFLMCELYICIAYCMNKMQLLKSYCTKHA